MLSKQELSTLIADTKTVANGTHYASLLGERKAGSKWSGEWTEAHFFSRAWTEYEPAEGMKMPGCHYYMASIAQSFPSAYVGAISLEEAQRMHMDIVVAQGTHGPELQTASILQVATDIATMIVGDEAGVQVIYTVHPGTPLAPLAKEFNGDLSSLSPLTAVKLI
jgi:hypothetical protein